MYETEYTFLLNVNCENNSGSAWKVLCVVNKKAVIPSRKLCIMAYRCCVPNCKKGETEVRHYFKFPDNYLCFTQLTGILL